MIETSYVQPRRGYRLNLAQLAGFLRCRLILSLTLLITLLPALAHAQSIVRIATTPPGRLFHIIGTGVAEIVNKNSKLDIRVLPVGQGVSWAPMMERGEMELAVIEAFEAYRIYRGTEEFKGASHGKGFDIRYVASGAPLAISFPVRADSNLHKLSDLKGKPVPVGYAGSPVFDFYTRAILANAGLTYRDIQQVPVAEIARARELFIQGRVVTPGTWQPTTGPISELDATIGIRFLGLDPSPAAVNRMTKLAPGSYVIKPGIYAGKTGVGPDTQLFALDLGLVASSKTPENVVYEAVKALYRHNDDFRKFHLILSDWKADEFVTDRVTVPFHPGAVRFYKEVGLWNPKIDNMNEKLKRR